MRESGDKRLNVGIFIVSLITLVLVVSIVININLGSDVSGNAISIPKTIDDGKTSGSILIANVVGESFVFDPDPTINNENCVEICQRMINRCESTNWDSYVNDPNTRCYENDRGDPNGYQHEVPCPRVNCEAIGYNCANDCFRNMKDPKWYRMVHPFAAPTGQ